MNRGIHDGIRAAFREINGAGGVRGQNLSFIAVDDGYDVTRSVQNIQALMTNYSLVGILSPSGTNAMSAWLPLAKNRSMPVYFMSSGTTTFRTPFDRSLIHLQVSFNDEIMALLNFALQELLHRRIAVVYQDDLFGGTCFADTVTALNRVGLTPWAVGKYPANAQNVTSALDTLLPVGTKPPHVVLVCGLAPQAAMVISGFHDRTSVLSDFLLLSVATVQEVQVLLGPTGNFANIFFASSTPDPHDTANPLISRARQALAAYNSSLAMPLHGHILGYTAGRLLHQALLRIDATTPITATTLNDIFMATSMFNVDGLQVGPYLDSGATACNQGLRTVWMAQVTATSWIGLPRGTFSWTGCLADPSALSLPILWGTMLSQQDPVEVAFQQGVRAAFQTGIRGTEVRLITGDAAAFPGWMDEYQLTGLVGVTSAMVANAPLTLPALVDSLGGRPVVGVLSGDTAFYSNNSHRTLLPQRASYLTEFYAVLQTVLDTGLSRVGVLCMADLAATRACNDATTALNDVKMRPAFVASVQASNLSWPVVADLLTSMPRFDDEAANLPAQAVLFVGRDSTVLRYLLDVSAQQGFAGLVWATASYLDVPVADPRLITVDVVPPRSTLFQGFYAALDAAGVVANSSNAAANAAAVQGYLTGSMIVLTSNNLASPYSGTDFVRNIYFTMRVTAHEVEIGPFADATECDGTHACKACRHGQSTVFVTPFNGTTISHRFPGCGPTPAAQSRKWPSTCSIRSRYGVELMRGIDRGMRVSAVGTVVSLGVLLVVMVVVLASAYMAMWNRPRKVITDRSSVILVRPSMANYIALLSIVMDAVELSSLFLPWQIPWVSILYGGAMGLYQSTGAEVASIVAALVWIAFAVIFLHRSLLHWFQRHAPFLLVLGAYLLPLIGNIGLLPVVSGLSAPFRISCTTNACYVMGDCSGSAWTLAHWGMIGVAGFCLLVYLPLVIYFSSLWQKLQEDLDVFVRTWLNVWQNVVKVLLCLLASLLPRSILPVLLVNLVATVALIAAVARRNPTRIPWYPIMKLCSLMAALGTAVIALVTFLLDVADPLIPTAALAIQWTATLSAGAIAFRRRFARIFLPTPRRRDKISMLAKLFRVGRRLHTSSTPTHMSASGEHLTSALPKFWKRTVTQWLVDLESRRHLSASDMTWLLLDLEKPVASLIHDVTIASQGDPDRFADLLLHQPVVHLIRARIHARDLPPSGRAPRLSDRGGGAQQHGSPNYELAAVEKGDIPTAPGSPRVLATAAVAMRAGIREESEAPLPSPVAERIEDRAPLVMGSGGVLSGEHGTLVAQRTATSTAAFNTAIHDGIRAVFREINLAGGVRGQNLSFITLDDGYNATRSLHNTQWLLQNYPLVGILSPAGTNPISAWLPVAKNYSVPVLFMTTGTSKFRDPFDRALIHLQVSFRDVIISGFHARSAAATAFFLIAAPTRDVQAVLGPTGNYDNIYFTSSTPDPHDPSNLLITRARQALAAYNTNLAIPLHTHVLGYMAGRLIQHALLRIDSTTPITAAALNDIFMATSMFNVDGLQIGPYLDSGTTACNQGLRTVWMARLTATSWIGLPRGTFSWTGCFPQLSSLSLPILWGTMLSQQDPVEVAFQQGVRAAFQTGIRGTEVQLITGDATAFPGWMDEYQLTGLVGVTSAMVANAPLTLPALVDALGGRPVVGVLSGDAAFYSNDSHRTLLPQRASYLTEFYAVLQTVLDEGLSRVGVLCMSDMATARACDDATTALNDMKMRPAFVASVQALNLSWPVVADLLTSMPRYDDEAANLPAQGVLFVGRDATVLRYLLDVSAQQGFAGVVWAAASYVDTPVADSRLITVDVVPPRSTLYRGFYTALDAAGVVTNSSNAVANAAAVQGFLTGSMIILTSNNLASPYSGTDFVRSIYFTMRVTAHEVEIGPFADATECGGTHACKACRHGQSTVFVTPFNGTTISHRFPGCGPTPAAQSRKWPSTCSIRSRYGVELMRGIDRGMRVSAVGTVVSLGVMLVVMVVVLASAYMAMWNRPRKVITDRSSVILVRPSMANYIALLSVVMDAVELSSLFLPWQVPWVSMLYGGAMGLYQSTGAQIASIVAALVWIAFAVIFLHRSLLHWFQRHAPFLLVLGAYLLPLIGNIGLLPVVSGLSAPFRISCTTNACYVMGDCSGSAWTLAHWGMIGVAGFCLLVYLPLVIYFSSLWQKLQEDLDVFVRTWLYVGQNVVKVLLCLLASLLPRFIFPVLIVNLVATVALIAAVARRNPTRIPWYPIMKLCSLTAALGTAVIALVTFLLDVANPLIPTAALAIQWTATLSAGAIAFRRRFARIFLPTPRRRDKISTLAKLFRVGRRSSTQQQQNSTSGEHLTSALPKYWKRIVTQWLVDLETRRHLSSGDMTWLLLDLEKPVASLVHDVTVASQGDPDRFADLLLHQPVLHLIRARILARDLPPGRAPRLSDRSANAGGHHGSPNYELVAVENGDGAVHQPLASVAMAMHAGILEESETPLPSLEEGKAVENGAPVEDGASGEAEGGDEGRGSGR
ncbi:hypothetical protein GGF32_002605 [Allomyces javanicus]|nr:hypothetical protein GGF32_002605 [Allomyces javanicus]